MLGEIYCTNYAELMTYYTYNKSNKKNLSIAGSCGTSTVRHVRHQHMYCIPLHLQPSQQMVMFFPVSTAYETH